MEVPPVIIRISRLRFSLNHPASLGYLHDYGNRHLRKKWCLHWKCVWRYQTCGEVVMDYTLSDTCGAPKVNTRMLPSPKHLFFFITSLPKKNSKLWHVVFLVCEPPPWGRRVDPPHKPCRPCHGVQPFQVTGFAVRLRERARGPWSWGASSTSWEKNPNIDGWFINL